ncbi:MAG: ABC transporter substrate-binding protein [Pigmentiphaga sp.]
MLFNFLCIIGSKAGRSAVCTAAFLGIALVNSSAFANDLTVVRVGILNSLSEVPSLLAYERGYFREQGIDVQFERFQNTADMVVPLSSGQIDVASGAPTLGFLNASLRGLPFKLVADKGRNSKGHGFNALVVRKELVDNGTVKTLADLKGLSVASPSRNSPMEFQLDIALRSVGLELEDIRIEQLTFPSMLSAMDNGAVDAALLIEPFVANASQRNIGVRLLGFDETSPDFQIAGLIYGPSFVEKNPDLASKWMIGYIRGVRDYLEIVESGQFDEETLAALGKHLAIFKNPAALEAVVFPGFNPDGYLHVQTISDSIEWYMTRGLLKSKPNVDDLVDYQYIEKALEAIGRQTS